MTAYSCPPCGVEWSTDEDCWACGQPGRLGAWTDTDGKSIPWTSQLSPGGAVIERQITADLAMEATG